MQSRELLQKLRGGKPSARDALERLKSSEGRPRAEARPGSIDFLNEGIVSVADAPFNLLGAAGKATSNFADALGIPNPRVPGSDAVFEFLSNPFRSALSTVGAIPDERPVAETTGEKIALGVGEAAGSLLPFLGVTSKAAQGAGIAAGAAKAVQAPFLQAPTRAGAAELAAGGGFRAAEDIAENQGIDNPALQAAAGLGGAVIAGAGPQAITRATGAVAKAFPGVNATTRFVKKTFAPFTDAGGKAIASERIRALSANPQADADAIAAGTIGNLSPAQATGSERLMALERAVLDKDAALDKKFKDQSADTVTALREAIKEGAGDKNKFRDFLEGRLERVAGLLETRVQQAQERAREKLSRLEPQRRASESSSIVANELDSALADARAQEKELYLAIPQDTKVPTSVSRGTFKRIFDDLPRAQREDVPREAVKFLSGDTNDAFAAEESIKELIGLRSKLLETSRSARKDANFNKARLSDDLANAILDDLGASENAVTPAGQAILAARSFSRQLNETFGRGTVGKILSFAKEGGRGMDPQIILDSVLASGTRGAVAADDILKAVADSPLQTNAAIQDFLTRRFMDTAAPRGQFVPERAVDFVRNNAEILERFPQFRDQITDATKAQQLVNREVRTSQVRAERLRDPKRSAAAAFLNAPVDEEFKAVVKAKNPALLAGALVRQARKDKTGQALAGLKDAALDYVIETAKTRNFTEAGEEVLSGTAITKILRDKRTVAALSNVLTNREMNRLQRIAREFRAVEKSRERGATVDILESGPNKIISFIATTLGARAGAKLGAGVSGASIKTASEGSKRMKQLLERVTQSQAEKLIVQSIQDPDLMETLLRGVNTLDAKTETRLLEAMIGAAGPAVAGNDR